MRALGDTGSVVQDQNSVGKADGRRPLGDDQGHGLPGKLPQGAAEGCVRGVVQGGGTVVQDQDGGMTGQGPGNGQALALAAREVRSALPDRLIEPQFLFIDGIGGLCRAQGFLQFILGRIRIPPEEIRADRSPEENRMLGNDADGLPQGGQAVFPDIPAAELYGAGGNVVKAGDQADQRGFAAAGTADDPDGLPGRGGEGNMLKARVAGRAVADRYILKRQADRAFRQEGFAVFLGGRGEQDVIDAPGTGGGFGQRDDQVGQLD